MNSNFIKHSTVKQQPNLGTLAYWSMFAPLNNGDRSSEITAGFREGWDG